MRSLQIDNKKLDIGLPMLMESTTEGHMNDVTYYNFTNFMISGASMFTTISGVLALVLLRKSMQDYEKSIAQSIDEDDPRVLTQ